MAERTSLVTGAGQGMGRAISLHLASQGHHVILVGKTKSKLESVAAEINAQGGKASAHELDIIDSAGVQALADSLSGTALDVLVNNAGDWLIQSMDTTTDAQLDHIVDVNLKAPYRLCRALLPNLRRSENASIINIGSMAAVNSYGGITAYTAAKTGLRGLTGSLAAELRPELIRVVMISPSPANTPMRWAATPDADPNTLVEPETIAQMVSMIVNLPKGITTSDLVLKSMLMDLSG